MMIVVFLNRSCTGRKCGLRSSQQWEDLKTRFILTRSSRPEHPQVTETRTQSHTRQRSNQGLFWMGVDTPRQAVMCVLYTTTEGRSSHLLSSLCLGLPRLSRHPSQCKYTPVVSWVQLCGNQSDSRDHCGHSSAIAPGREQPHYSHSRGE